MLVNGFDLKIFSCDDFVKNAESGEVYFSKLLPSIETAFGSANRILVFTYPTFNSFDFSGDQLADRLNDLATNGGIKNVILIGHSMGGLVSRSATYRLKVIYRRPSLVKGIITLGTPHNGIAKADAELNKYFGFNEGVNSMVAGLRDRPIEEAPIFAFAGELPLPVLKKKNCTGVGTSGAIGAFYTKNCSAIGSPNDGLIEVSSALPDFITAGTAHRPTFIGYDHSEMKAGDNSTGSPTDRLLTGIVEDVRTILSFVPPDAPSNLTAIAASASQVDLTWNDNSSNEDGFRIERAPSGSTSFAQVGSAGVNSTTFSNVGLSGSTSYSYRVSAFKSATISEYSNVASATTASGATEVPGTIMNVSIGGAPWSGTICVMSKYLAPYVPGPNETKTWTIHVSKNGMYPAGTSISNITDINVPSCEYFGTGVLNPATVTPSLSAGDLIYVSITDPDEKTVFAVWTWDGTKAVPKTPASETLVATDVGNYISEFTLSGSQLFYFAQPQYVGCLQQTLKQVSATTGQVTSLATNIPCGNRVLSDGNYVYWTDGEQGYGIKGSIRRVPVGGGVTETLVTDLTGTYASPYQPLQLDGGYVYFESYIAGDPSDRVRIQRVPIGGGAVTDVISTSFIGTFTVSGGTVYYQEDDPLQHCAPNSVANIKAVPVSGGVPTTIASGVVSACGGSQLYVSGGTLYVVNGSANDLLSTVPIGGGSLVTRATGMKSPFRLIVDGNYLYLSENAGGSVSRLDKNTFQKTVLSWTRSAIGVAVDADAVYWTSIYAAKDNCCGGAPFGSIVRIKK